MGIYARGCASGDGFDAVFAGFCAGFRRGKRGYVSGDVRAGMVLTRCLQGSAQGFAESSRDLRAGMCERGWF